MAEVTLVSHLCPNLKFTTQQAVNRHHTYKHTSELDVMDRTCPYCQKLFNRKDVKLCHMKTHMPCSITCKIAQELNNLGNEEIQNDQRETTPIGNPPLRSYAHISALQDMPITMSL